MASSSILKVTSKRSLAVEVVGILAICLITIGLVVFNIEGQLDKQETKNSYINRQYILQIYDANDCVEIGIKLHRIYNHRSYDDFHAADDFCQNMRTMQQYCVCMAAIKAIKNGFGSFNPDIPEDLELFSEAARMYLCDPRTSRSHSVDVLLPPGGFDLELSEDSSRDEESDIEPRPVSSLNSDGRDSSVEIRPMSSLNSNDQDSDVEPRPVSSLNSDGRDSSSVEPRPVSSLNSNYRDSAVEPCPVSSLNLSDQECIELVPVNLQNPRDQERDIALDPMDPEAQNEDQLGAVGLSPQQNCASENSSDSDDGNMFRRVFRCFSCERSRLDENLYGYYSANPRHSSI